VERQAFAFERDSYGTITVISPGMTKLIIPAHMHMFVEVLSSVGMLPSITVGAPGTQGETVIGMQGIGVRTPIAAAVAAATIGFAGDMHIPKGMILTSGTKSMMLASGTSSVMTRLMGRTTSELGAIPMVHIMVAPIQTCIGIMRTPSQLAAGHFSKGGIECNCRE
jgi:hypothetical protein